MIDPNSGEALKYRKLRRAILVGLIISIIVLLANLYSNYFGRKNGVHETEIEHEMYELSQRLFANEQKHNRYLLKINYQGQTSIHDQHDHAKEPLLKLHEDLLANDTYSTIYLMQQLFDNYNLDTDSAEHVTEQEKKEEIDFLTAILNTTTMKHAMAFLERKGYVSAGPQFQLQLLQEIWFQQYPDVPGRTGSCSGFEHVFLADLTKHSVIGLHNWIFFHEQEKAGKLDYKGYIEKIDFDKHDQHLVGVRFSFLNISMPYNTLFVGTSPELELSLYTVCFLIATNLPCPIQFGRTKFSIITHSWNLHDKTIIGLAYPIIDDEFRPFPARKLHAVEVCQTSLKCLKCKKMHDMKNKRCYN